MFLMRLGLKNRPFVPHNLIPVWESPVPLLKFQVSPRPTLNVLWTKKEEPRCTCLSEAKAAHLQRIWAKVSSSTPQLLHKGLLIRLSYLYRKNVL